MNETSAAFTRSNNVVRAAQSLSDLSEKVSVYDDRLSALATLVVRVDELESMLLELEEKRSKKVVAGEHVLPKEANEGKVLQFTDLALLVDPVFNLKSRDDLIGWDSKDRAKRLVNIMDAYVLGAIPPYNRLLGGGTGFLPHSYTRGA